MMSCHEVVVESSTAQSQRYTTIKGRGMLLSTVMAVILSGVLCVLLARLLGGLTGILARTPIYVHRMSDREDYDLPVDIARRKLGIRPRHSG